jgi:hypothetical protein
MLYSGCHPTLIVRPAYARDLRFLYGHGILNFTGFTVVRAVGPFPFSSQPLIPPAVCFLGVFSMTKSLTFSVLRNEIIRFWVSHATWSTDEDVNDT